ncbi:MAG: hypothetical protein R8K46_08890 [Mariprofundaceae bacterium]
MIRTTARVILILIPLAWPCMAWAAPELKVSVSAEQEVTISENGESRIERVAARDIKPGNEIIYTIVYVNDGDETANNVVIEDPIPANGVYVADSNIAPGAETSFSIDGGESFAAPSRVTYEIHTADGMQERVAEPSQYTHIRWLLPKVEAGQRGQASFRVRVK